MALYLFPQRPPAARPAPTARDDRSSRCRLRLPKPAFLHRVCLRCDRRTCSSTALPDAWVFSTTQCLRPKLASRFAAVYIQPPTHATVFVDAARAAIASEWRRLRPIRQETYRLSFFFVLAVGL